MTTAIESESIVEEKPEKFSIVKGFLKGLLYGLTFISIALILATIVIPRLIGAVPLTVLTGSMVPTFNPGDLIVTMPIDASEVKRGDIITFQPESGVNTLITHRVESVGFSIGGDTVFVTKGDANNASDEPIIADQVMGKYLYHVPYVGYLANAIPTTNKPVIMQVLGIGFFIWAGIQVILIIIGNFRKKKKKDQSEIV